MTKSNKKNRNRMLIIFIILVSAAFTAYYITKHSTTVSTNNAYVEGDKVTITSEISGTVQSISVQATDPVKKGEVLIQLDKNDLDIEQQNIESALRQTINMVKSEYESIAMLQSQIDINRISYEQAKSDLKRRKGGDKDGSVLPEALSHAKNLVQISLQKYNASKTELAAKRALYPDEPILDHPDIQKAISNLKKIYLAEINSTIKSPIDGAIALRSAQVGEQIQAGQPLLAAVPLNKVWVVANFKETKLKHIKIGQKASITSDLYGKNQVYSGVVSGIGAGTGGVFSALPPENATGNWIKIVQRLPVRIEINHEELMKKPLRMGMSMTVSIDTTSDNPNYVPPNHENNISEIYLEKSKLVNEKANRLVDELLNPKS